MRLVGGLGPGRRIGRRIGWSLALALVILLLGGPALRANLKPRAALWLVIRGCVLMRDTLGTPLPCLSVDPASAGAPGYAILRAPGNPTHVITTPIVPISGMESEVLLQPDAGLYWRAALMSRRYVEAGADGPVPPGDVGLAINSRRTRSQDQLHIHAECVRPDVLQAIRAQSGEIGPAWRLLAHAVDRERLFARTVTAATLASDNLFAILAEIPGTRGDLSHVTALVVAAGGGGGEPDRFHVIAGSARSRTIEVYLDESCRAVSRRR